MEIHSAWGTFEWLVQEALKIGYCIGICASSDGHRGRPGSSFTGAVKERHFYATTGHRPILAVHAILDGEAKAMMGDVIGDQAEL